MLEESNTFMANDLINKSSIIEQYIKDRRGKLRFWWDDWFAREGGYLKERKNRQ